MPHLSCQPLPDEPVVTRPSYAFLPLLANARLYTSCRTSTAYPVPSITHVTRPFLPCPYARRVSVRYVTTPAVPRHCIRHLGAPLPSCLYTRFLRSPDTPAAPIQNTTLAALPVPFLPLQNMPMRAQTLLPVLAFTVRNETSHSVPAAPMRSGHSCRRLTITAVTSARDAPVPHGASAQCVRRRGRSPPILPSQRNAAGSSPTHSARGSTPAGAFQGWS